MGSKYMCIHCGTSATSLYKEYTSTVLKLCYCETCQYVVDSYVETDMSIILIDTALQRLKAYRHLLHNDPPQKMWKFAIICLLCDAYFKWVTYRMTGSKQTSYYELEWLFYLASFLSFIDNTIFFLSIVCLLLLTSEKALSAHVTLVNLLAVSGCGKLFCVPAVLWGWNEGHINHLLINLFLLVTTIQACRVPQDNGIWKTSAVVLTSFTVKTYIGSHLYEHILENIT